MNDEKALVRARSVARALDSAVTIPGTGIKFGLDALFGLLPVAGDAAGAALSGYVVILAAKAGASPALIARMVLNILLDTVVGAVPILGDMFDIAWKSNNRNVALLERHVGVPAEVKRTSRVVVFLAAVALLLIALGGITLAVLLVRGVFGLIS